MLANSDPGQNVSIETMHADVSAPTANKDQRTHHTVLAEIPKSATLKDVLRALKQNNVVKKDFPISNRKHIYSTIC